MSLQNTKGLALAAISLSVLVVGLDATILNVALATLASSLKASISDLQWFVNAFSLAFAAMLIPAGALGDRYGRKLGLMSALLVFGLASVACALAQTSTALIVARAFLGLSGAFLLPLSMASLVVIFRPEERPRAIGIWTLANALSFPLGPIVGGWLLEHFAWSSVFLINVPVVALALVAVFLWLPESKNEAAKPIDVSSVLLSGAGLSLLTYGATQAGVSGWGTSAVLISLLAGLLCSVWFILRQVALQRSGRNPLIDLSLFSRPAFTWGTLVATLGSFGMFGFLFSMPLFFQTIQRTSPLTTGLQILPLVLGLAIGSRLAERLMVRFGTKVMMSLGMLLMALALFWGSQLQISTPFSTTVLWMTLLGAGLGFALPTAMSVALGTLSSSVSGAGSALIQAIRQIGAISGVALLGTMLNTLYRNTLDVTGLPKALVEVAQTSLQGGLAVAAQLQNSALELSARHAFVSGIGASLLCSSLLTLLGCVLISFWMPHPTPEPSAKDGMIAA